LQLISFYPRKAWLVNYSSIFKLHLYFSLAIKTKLPFHIYIITRLTLSRWLYYHKLTIVSLNNVRFFFSSLVCWFLGTIYKFELENGILPINFIVSMYMIALKKLGHLSLTIFIITLIILLFMFAPQEWLSMANILALTIFNP